MIPNDMIPNDIRSDLEMLKLCESNVKCYQKYTEDFARHQLTLYQSFALHVSFWHSLKMINVSVFVFHRVFVGSCLVLKIPNTPKLSCT